MAINQNDFSRILENIFMGENIHMNNNFSEVLEYSRLSPHVIFYIPSYNGTIIKNKTSNDFLGRNEENNGTFHIIVKSTFEKAYPIQVDDFLINYEITSVQNSSNIDQTLDFISNNSVEKGTAVHRSISASAIQSNIYGYIKTPRGYILPFSPGNFIIKHGKNLLTVLEDFIFEKTYIYNS